ncbi:transcriptional regulator /transcriptional regulator, LuxR family [Rhizobium sp. RU20A]|uniref:LuxR C-terminal-related transcriptional regulator n=1 Tax=Rhizobium sp. RU20A TaxID=1907412 RepID=UPI0009566018|nr:LuxR C-terminal-related transcriptional regulator [Rhizobium sp. RU20A]SIR18469.1 transcriptional regulator /transcriptional regulator, LuxR family [Rhizobium sp. RU20A]
MHTSHRKQIRFRPPLDEGKIARRALLETLSQTRLRRLNLIVAPAGYGKTSLAAQWYAHLAQAGLTVLWVSLDPDDNDQTGFLLALIEMLDAVTTDAAVESDRGSLSVATMLAVLVTRLERLPGPVALFIDDYHLAQTDANESVLARLLARPELSHIKFIIVSRSAPHLPRSALRLVDEFRQIGVAELAFSDGEAEALFAGSGARLNGEDLIELNRRAEGWAVALQMMRLLVEDDGADGRSILEAFDGHNEDMGRYLAEQAFSGLPEALRRLLMETACLPAISRDLVAAVCDFDTADAFGMLRDSALPFAVLDRDGHWMRCHPVFNAYLREAAEQAGRPARERLVRAARWFEKEGDLLSAVDHAFLAGAAALAAEIIEAGGGWQRVYMTKRGGPGLFRRLADMAEEVDLQRYPLTTLGLAVVSAKTGQLDAADHYMALARKTPDVGNEGVAQALRVIGVLLALYTDRWVSAAELAALEADLLREGGLTLVHRGLSLNMLSYNFLIRSDLERAQHYGRLAMQTFRDGGAEFGAIHLYLHVGQAAYFDGDVISAQECYDALADEAVRLMGRGSDLDAMANVLKAELLTARGNIPAAEALLNWALPHVERHDAWHDLLAAGFTAQQRMLRLKGDIIAAHEAMDRARAVARRRGFDRLTRLIDAERAGLLLVTGDLEEAVRFAEANGLGARFAGDGPANDLSIRLRGGVPALLWTRIHLETGDLLKSRATFTRLITQQRQKPHAVRAMELDLVDIRLSLAEGRSVAAAERLCDLLLTQPLADYRALVTLEGQAFIAGLTALARDHDLPDLIRKRLDLVLADTLDGSGAAGTGAPSASALTDREEAVMRLLSEGLANKEIGRRLSLSDNTVKFHLRNIFAKLKVTTRTAAVSAARQSGILA